MNKAFTLMELLMVIIIIGVLVVVGVVQWNNMSERARKAEAYTVLGHIREAQLAYYERYDTYTNNLTDLPVDVEEDCNQTVSYYMYEVHSDAPETCFVAVAKRCTSGGKPPANPNPNPCQITLNEKGKFLEYENCSSPVCY